MKQYIIRWSTLITMVIFMGIGQSVWAHTSVNETAAMPLEMHSNGTQYITGGIGLDQSTVFKHIMASHKYPLAIQLYGIGGEYLSDVPVVITDAHKKVVFDAASEGPFILVKLPAGKYSVIAHYKGKEQRRAVTVPKHGQTKVRFDWK